MSPSPGPTGPVEHSSGISGAPSYPRGNYGRPSGRFHRAPERPPAELYARGNPWLPELGRYNNAPLLVISAPKGPGMSLSRPFFGYEVVLPRRSLTFSPAESTA